MFVENVDAKTTKPQRGDRCIKIMTITRENSR